MGTIIIMIVIRTIITMTVRIAVIIATIRIVATILVILTVVAAFLSEATTKLWGEVSSQMSYRPRDKATKQLHPRLNHGPEPVHHPSSGYLNATNASR